MTDYIEVEFARYDEVQVQCGGEYPDKSVRNNVSIFYDIR